MGLPIEQLIIATNANDILRRTLDTGRYDMDGVAPTISPSMDIQISSNFERLLFEAAGQDAAAVVQMMDGLKQSGGFAVPERALDAIRAEFASGTTGEDDTKATITRTLAKTGYLLDPHTAVGVHVARHGAIAHIPMITLATAHPAKFPAAVKTATGGRTGPAVLACRSAPAGRATERCWPTTCWRWKNSYWRALAPDLDKRGAAHPARNCERPVRGVARGGTE